MVDKWSYQNQCETWIAFSKNGSRLATFLWHLQNCCELWFWKYQNLKLCFFVCLFRLKRRAVSKSMRVSSIFLSLVLRRSCSLGSSSTVLHLCVKQNSNWIDSQTKLISFRQKLFAIEMFQLRPFVRLNRTRLNYSN